MKLFKTRLSKSSQQGRRDEVLPPRPSVIRNMNVLNTFEIPTYNRFSALDKLSPIPQLDGNISVLSSPSDVTVDSEN